VKEDLTGSSTRRLESVDALRGFALLGVLVTHFVAAMDGYPYFLSEVTVSSLPLPELNSLAYRLNKYLVGDKFRALFSMLFGLSFYFLLKKSERDGKHFTAIFSKRLFILLLFGLVHAYLIWYGDILRYYAVAGFFLLFSYQWKNRTILCLGFLLVMVVPVIISLLSAYLHVPDQPYTLSAVRRGFFSDSYIGMLKSNYMRDLNNVTNIWRTSSYFSTILGFFYIGLWTGKSQILYRLQQRGTRLVWIVLASLTIAVLGTEMRFFSHLLHHDESLTNELLRAIGFRLNVVGLFVFYGLGFVALYHFTVLQKILRLFSYVGKMSLTNYIMQSVMGVMLFNGIGLGMMGDIGPAITLPLALAFFSFQVMFSMLWLSRFKSGPLEWLWRFLMEGKVSSVLKQRKVSGISD